MIVKLSLAIMKQCWGRRGTPSIRCWEPFGCRRHNSLVSPCPSSRILEVADPLRNIPECCLLPPIVKAPIPLLGKSAPCLVLAHVQTCMPRGSYTALLSFMSLSLAPIYNVKYTAKGQNILVFLFSYPSFQL